MYLCIGQIQNLLMIMIRNVEITANEIIDAIKGHQDVKSPGVDGISPEFLKFCRYACKTIGNQFQLYFYT